MGQLSEMNLDEWMMVVSTLMAMPAMIILLLIVFLGKFPHSEEERYLAIAAPERDYWDDGPEAGPADVEAAGEPAREGRVGP